MAIERNVSLYGKVNKIKILLSLHFGLFLISSSVASAFLHTKSPFVGSTISRLKPSIGLGSKFIAPNDSTLCLRQSLSSGEEILSSADVDSDEDAEQRLGDEIELPGPFDSSYGEFQVGDGPNRWEGLLASTGLEGRLRHVVDLPDERKVSTFDIFCNRELKMENLAAIGFDMDYTLARYQQPAFDKLAFDGAKEKLVRKLG